MRKIKDIENRLRKAEELNPQEVPIALVNEGFIGALKWVLGVEDKTILKEACATLKKEEVLYIG